MLDPMIKRLSLYLHRSGQRGDKDGHAVWNGFRIEPCRQVPSWYCMQHHHVILPQQAKVHQCPEPLVLCKRTPGASGQHLLEKNYSSATVILSVRFYRNFSMNVIWLTCCENRTFGIHANPIKRGVNQFLTNPFGYYWLYTIPYALFQIRSTSEWLQINA